MQERRGEHMCRCEHHGGQCIRGHRLWSGSGQLGIRRLLSSSAARGRAGAGRVPTTGIAASTARATPWLPRWPWLLLALAGAGPCGGMTRMASAPRHPKPIVVAASRSSSSTRSARAKAPTPLPQRAGLINGRTTRASRRTPTRTACTPASALQIAEQDHGERTCVGVGAAEAECACAVWKLEMKLVAASGLPVTAREVR
ncbi:hypothetical protein E2562_039449 [Oryza meyeriana var. granulata]|uniref:Uncharacterized protein n=1 Tax=Oryza meyeriana var. granulata TaxID=110450 RepID=A0A6G1E9I2_9ORYZ|nr:hypothetical protein E2562_039449 [Oryza meyeriana var. granulata]